MTEARLQREAKSLKGNPLKSRSLASQTHVGKWALFLHKVGGCT